jgi:beta-1,4-mannosyl-glycoprotein beta-1,4-N-acetylglucosaminyltransferase
MIKLYDGFQFNNEFELLELRFKEHWNYVDKFILVESLTDHRGNPKPLHYAEHKQKFHQYKDKIQHIVVGTVTQNVPYQWGTPNTGSPDDQARNHIPWGMYNADPDDILMVSDVDEIWRPSALEFMKNDRSYSIFSPLQSLSHFKINFICATHSDPNRCNGYMAWSKAIRFRDFKSYWKLDATAFKANGYLSCWTIDPNTLRMLNACAIPHGGWHFSWWGKTENILDKMSTYGHQEQDTDYVRRLIESDSIISGKLAGIALPQIGNMFPEHKWITCQVDEYFPQTILDNLEQYQHVITPHATGKITDYLPPFIGNLTDNEKHYNLLSQLIQNTHQNP